MHTLMTLALQVAAAQVAPGGIVATSVQEVRIELTRPAYVAVLRAWPDSSVELVYPFDPLVPAAQRIAVASHQMRFGAGVRRVVLSTPTDAYLSLRPANVTSITSASSAYDLACLQRQYAADGRGATWKNPEDVRGAWRCGVGYRRRDVAAVDRSIPRMDIGPHQLVVIVSDERLDLMKVSRAVGTLRVADVRAVVTRALSAQRGSWHVYIAPVD